MKYYAYVFSSLCCPSMCLPCCDVRCDLHIKRCSVRFYPQLFVEGLMSYLRYLCLLAYSGVQLILGGVFLGFFFHILFVLSLVKLPVSRDCPFFISLSVFSNVYLTTYCNRRWRPIITPLV